MPLVAGQFAPKGTGIPEDGGYRAPGNDQFGSPASTLDYARGRMAAVSEPESDA